LQGSRVLTDTDILIIGGGIYGCGVAQAAAAHGYRTMLIEKADIASGTSSRSSKLIHGGLRYLESGQFHLVSEALQERRILLKIAPSLVHMRQFYVPVYAHHKRPAWKIAAGLFLYYVFSGFTSPFRRVPEKKWLEAVPGLKLQGLKALFEYQDAATDDAALTRAVAASARAMGTEIRTNTALHRAAFNAAGWHVELEGGEAVTAKMIINAAGPWVNQVQECCHPLPPMLLVSLVQGSHIVLPAVQSAYVYAEAADGREVFIMPWQGNTLVGTTETVFSGDPAACTPDEAEVDYLLDVYNSCFPGKRLARNAIIGRFAGVRVLPESKGDFFSRSRETVRLADRDERPRLIAIYGGKLTTYRREAEKVMQAVARTLPPPKGEVDTAEILLPDA